LGIVAEELERLAADVRGRAGVACAWALLDDARLAAGIERAELVIHCTPVGMSPCGDETAVPARLWRPGLPVMDIVYNPRETRLLREARAAGCRVVPGFEMLLNQGVLQFETWTGVPAPIEIMRSALIAGLDKK
jgi:shikimate dehydrogenase